MKASGGDGEYGYGCGRRLLLRWGGPLDGRGPAPALVAARSDAGAVRLVLLDMTGAPYADSDGLRWLLRLRDGLEARGKGLRIAARPGGNVWRNLGLLGADLDVFESVRAAWKAPGQAAAGETPPPGSSRRPA